MAVDGANIVERHVVSREEPAVQHEDATWHGAAEDVGEWERLEGGGDERDHWGRILAHHLRRSWV